MRIDLQGMNSLFGDRLPRRLPDRGPAAAGRCAPGPPSWPATAAHEMELLYFGPAGGGGVVASVVPALGVTPAYVPRELVSSTSRS